MSAIICIWQPERVVPNPDSGGYGIKSDVWSFGITMVTMLCLVTFTNDFIHLSVPYCNAR